MNTISFLETHSSNETQFGEFGATLEALIDVLIDIRKTKSEYGDVPILEKDLDQASGEYSGMYNKLKSKIKNYNFKLSGSGYELENKFEY